MTKANDSHDPDKDKGKDEPEDIHLNLTVTPGEPVSFEVPEGVSRVTLNFDQSFLGQPLPSTERRPGFLGSLTQGCGGLLLGCFTVLVIIGLIGMLFGP